MTVRAIGHAGGAGMDPDELATIKGLHDGSRTGVCPTCAGGHAEVGDARHPCDATRLVAAVEHLREALERLVSGEIPALAPVAGAPTGACAYCARPLQYDQARRRWDAEHAPECAWALGRAALAPAGAG